MTGLEFTHTAGSPAEPAARACPPEPTTGHRPPQPCRLVKDLESGLELRLTETAGCARVTVQGEVDLGCAPLLEQVLAETLRGAPDSLEVDLRDVGFLDCSGLNALLRVRQKATGSGIPLHVTDMSPAVRRVLELTCTQALFD